jgi:hypothetical protein
MEAKSPVEGNSEPIFSPLALLAVVVELAGAVVALSLAVVVVVVVVVVVFVQAAAKKPDNKVAKLRAKAELIFFINYFHSSDLWEPESNILTRLSAEF